MCCVRDPNVKWHNDFLQGSTPEDEVDRSSQNVRKKPPLTRWVTTQKSAVLLGAIVGTYLSAIVSRNLAEGFITVDNWKVDDLSIGQEEAAVRCNRRKTVIRTNTINQFNAIYWRTGFRRGDRNTQHNYTNTYIHTHTHTGTTQPHKNQNNKKYETTIIMIYTFFLPWCNSP
jgi:hypothetical protein